MLKSTLLLQSALLATAAVCTASQGQESPAVSKTQAVSAVSTDATAVALSGYDVVSYFDEKHATKGKPEITTAHDGATYHFVSAEHRDMFDKDPERYLPQYGGYCAYGTSAGHKAKADPEAWTVIDGKLYLNYNKKVQKEFLKDPKVRLQQADANWKTLSH